LAPRAGFEPATLRL